MLLCAAPWLGAPPAALDLQMERVEEDRDKWAPATLLLPPLVPAAALRPLLAGTSLGSLQRSTHSSSASTQFSFGSNKKWKLKAAQAADKALLKTAWDQARDGVQGRGRSKGNCKPTAISRDWIIKKNNIFSIFFFFFYPLLHWDNKTHTSKYQQTVLQPSCKYFQLRTSLLQRGAWVRRQWLTHPQRIKLHLKNTSNAWLIYHAT